MSGQIQAYGCLSLGKKLEVTFSDHLPDPMLRCAVLSRCAGTAFYTIRNPCAIDQALQVNGARIADCVEGGAGAAAEHGATKHGVRQMIRESYF